MNVLNSTSPLLQNRNITPKTSCLTQWKHLVKPCFILIAILVFSAPVAYSLSELIMIARHKSPTVSNLIKIVILSSKKSRTMIKTKSSTATKYVGLPPLLDAPNIFRQ
ncbi:Glyco_18 domain-containing protein [Caenorhabditis elegans]|uniref:Glyco_18 domain-containing protein n=1 Tax=Caenorhabditis elegans TaxID=6239 RepID=Q17838_CAEEL|nr:Glyco_18 domain-containing protein [Caenorhabditis elegans]CAA91151.2 Glyco_18 domain-containing protein [Caenorhabditis elegans]|eukprot:NP_001040739.1 CHItinase-Like [Caenorhabditis elegans]